MPAEFDPRPFIARAAWRLSTTTADKPNWKHWYIVESLVDDPDFRRFADLIAAEGYDARFEATATSSWTISSTGRRGPCSRQGRT